MTSHSTPLFLLCLAILLLTPGLAPAWDDPRYPNGEPDAEAIISDTLVCRPLGLVATGVGATLFVVAAPFAWAGDNMEVVTEKLLYEPARFTFTRPLGSPECRGALSTLLLLGLSR